MNQSILLVSVIQQINIKNLFMNESQLLNIIYWIKYLLKIWIVYKRKIKPQMKKHIYWIKLSKMNWSKQKLILIRTKLWEKKLIWWINYLHCLDQWQEILQNSKEKLQQDQRHIITTEEKKLFLIQIWVQSYLHDINILFYSFSDLKLLNLNIYSIMNKWLDQFHILEM